MIRSMTGFGKNQVELPGKLITTEIKCLNSKQLDLNVRLPGNFRDKEPEIRSLASQKLERGKIEITVVVESKGEEASFTLNKTIWLDYYRQFKELIKEIPDETDTALLPILARMPEVLKAEKDEPDEREWKLVLQCITDTIDMVDTFRLQEGSIHEEDMKSRISGILEMVEKITPFESGRISNQRKKILNQISELLPNGEYDQNRLEQEMIYYLEKFDITEEKVRLKKHCEYFLETMFEKNSNGKKLGFISQEIGREINTLGSKANDVNIQKIVILMKDELEKVKEQLNNIL